MTKIVFTAGKSESPLYKVTIETIFPNHGSEYDLQELIAKYFVHHGGLQWSVNQE
jgi:hypothetical protein